MAEDSFEPRLGGSTVLHSRSGASFLKQCLISARRAGPRPYRRFVGSRIGRGSGTARLLVGARHFATQRRVVVKAQVVRLGQSGMASGMKHLHYLERDGGQRDGSPARVYTSEEDEADGKNFVETTADDRHQFRLIVSAEDGDEYDYLKPLIRRFMGQMERDLGTTLQWIAVDHDNTAHPHSHIVLRGRDELGKNLVIAPEYLYHGMRERLSDLVTYDLGPRSDFEIRHQYRHELDVALIVSRGGINAPLNNQRKLEFGFDNLFRDQIRTISRLTGIGDSDWTSAHSRSGPSIA